MIGNMLMDFDLNLFKRIKTQTCDSLKELLPEPVIKPMSSNQSCPLSLYESRALLVNYIGFLG